MGWSLCWLAVKGKSTQAVRDELGLRSTGVRKDFFDADLSAAELPDGWYLILSMQAEQIALDSVLQQLTVGCEAVTCLVEEHVMVSAATGWKDGRRCWAILHDAQTAIEHLRIDGEPPSLFGSVRDRLCTKQQEAGRTKARVDHIFDIPVDTAHALTGYRHDKTISGLPDDAFEVLAGSVPVGAKKSFWKRLFGT